MKPRGHRSIMASRREPPDSLEFYPTPPWATRALCELVLERRPGFSLDELVWEPAAGEGHMAEVLREYFVVWASDVFDYGHGYAKGSFAAERVGLVDDLARCPFRPDWIITNPPFALAELFLARALEEAACGVALLVRASWLEGLGRYEAIFSRNPPSTVAIFSERVPMCKGRWDPEGSTATAYAWLVWDKTKRKRGTELVWIPPGQRERLTKPDDIARFAPSGEDLFT